MTTTATTPTSTMTTSTLQDEQAIAELMTGWIYRDTGDWDRLRGLFHPDARISLSWFSGAATDFVDASARMAHSALRTKHVITAPVIRFAADRARAATETNAIVVADNSELRLGAITHTRFLDRIERRDGRWAIDQRNAVYDFSFFTFPCGSVDIDEDAAARRPAPYAALGYLLDRSGAPVHDDEFVVRNSPRERALRDDIDAWLTPPTDD